MTTNIYDVNACTVASDSRWSIVVTNNLGGHHAIVYVDDTGCEKIAYTSEHAFVFAGNGTKIQEWKDWIASPNKVMLQVPDIPDDQFSICAIESASGHVLFEKGNVVMADIVRAAGSGAFPALTCWSSNRCAVQAVNSAILIDACSGGKVNFLKLKTSECNFVDSISIQQVNADLKKKGMIMYPHKTEKPVPVDGSNDPLIKSTLNLVANGKASVGAPVGVSKFTWKEKDHQELVGAMKKIFKI